ncbi:hypothetical protein [Paraburkholderia sp. MM6662-R1]|uniref:hypothetical protein n=1 Tax=Paraburkholderia sp. MM6662-R1 TaxID=2991066 RepID=UPI003D209ABA
MVSPKILGPLCSVALLFSLLFGSAHAATATPVTPVVISADAVMSATPSAMAVYPGAHRVYVGGASSAADGKNLAVLSLDASHNIVGAAQFYPETTFLPLAANEKNQVEDMVVDPAAGRLYIAWSDVSGLPGDQAGLSVYDLDNSGNIVSGPVSIPNDCSATGSKIPVPCTQILSLAIAHLKNGVEMLYVGVNETSVGGSPGGGGILIYSLGTGAGLPSGRQNFTLDSGSDGSIEQIAVNANGDKLYAGGSGSGLTTFNLDPSTGLLPNPANSIQRQASDIAGPALFQRFTYSPEAIYPRPPLQSPGTTTPLKVWPLQSDIPASTGPKYPCVAPFPDPPCLIPVNRDVPIVDATATALTLTTTEYDERAEPPAFQYNQGIVGTGTWVYTVDSGGQTTMPPASTVLTPGQMPLMTASSADGLPVVLTTAYPGYAQFTAIDLTSQYQIFVSLLNVASGQCPANFTVRQPGTSLNITMPVGKQIGSTCPSAGWQTLDITDPPLVGQTGQVLFAVGVKLGSDLTETLTETPDPATYQIQIGQVPSSGGPVQTLATLTDTVSLTAATGNPVLILVPGYAYTGDAQAAMETAAGHAQKYQSWAAAAKVLQPPTKFTVSAYSYFLGEYSPALIAATASALQSLGFNTVGFVPDAYPYPASTLPGNAETMVDSALTAAGIPNRTVVNAGIAYTFDYQCEGTGVNCPTTLTSAMKNYSPVPKQVKEALFWDEPGWYYPDVWINFPAFVSKADLLKAYNTYMTDLQSKHKGLTFSFKSGPIGRGSAVDGSSLDARQQFYWTTKFYDRQAAEFVQMEGKAIHAIFPNAFAYVDWSPDSPYTTRTYRQWNYYGSVKPSGLDDASQTMDWFLSARLNANLWAEQHDWDYSAEYLSFVGAVLRSASMEPPSNTPCMRTPSKGFGNFTVGSDTGSHPEGASYKILSLVGQGAKIVDVYGFGPKVIPYTGNPPSASVIGSDDNAWSENQAAYRPVANAIRRLGETESILYPGEPARSKVAVQLPGQSSLWFPVTSSDCTPKCPSPGGGSGTYELYSMESAGLYYALEHAGYSVDFVDDVDLAGGCSNKESVLSERGYQVLYLTQLNISAGAQAEIAKWVQAGGTVVATAGAGLWDEYNSLSKGGPGTLANVLGLNVPAPLTKSTPTGPWGQLRENPDKMLSTLNSTSAFQSWLDAGMASNMANPFASTVSPVSGSPYKIPFGPVRLFAAPLSPASSTEVVAQFTGSGASVPAVTVHRYGKGTAIAYGFFPGTEYLLSQERLAPDRLPSHWDADARTRAVTPVTQAPTSVTRLVYADVPLVEALRLDSTAGTGVVLLNWNDWQVGDSPLTVNVFIAGAAGKTVTSVEGNPLTTMAVGSDLKVNMKMKNVDILTVK